MRHLIPAVLTLAALLPSTNMKAADKNAEKLLRHVVLFQFKDSVTEEQVKEVEDAFAALPKKIDVIHGFEFGTNNSPEGLAQDFTHCFFVTFKSEKDRDAYLPHAAHQEFVKLVKPRLEKVLVVDYWAQE